MILPIQAVDLYETDYPRWLELTLAQSKNHDYSRVDWEHLLGDLEDMSKQERRACLSNLIVLLVHLLKWQYQPEKRSGSWQATILGRRRRVGGALTDSPSLKPWLENFFKGPTNRQFSKSRRKQA